MAYKDPEKQREYARLYRLNHLEELRRKNNEYTAKHKIKINASRRLKRKSTRVRDRYYDLKRKYNLTKEQHEHLLIQQENKCAICDTHQKDLTTALVVDHAHHCCNSSTSCGKCVRGLLCRNCNRALGFFKDSIDIVGKAINYLKQKRPDSKYLV